MKYSYVYILTDKNNKTLYIGVTSNLVRRIYEHRNHQLKGFTEKYNITKLVYYEEFLDIYQAVSREKQLKGKLRNKKLKLINNFNPEWKDLYPELINPDEF